GRISLTGTTVSTVRSRRRNRPATASVRTFPSGFAACPPTSRMVHHTADLPRQEKLVTAGGPAPGRPGKALPNLTPHQGPDHPGIQGQRLHERQANDEGREDAVGRVRIAADRLHGRGRRTPLSERGAERGEAEAETGPQGDEALMPRAAATASRRRVHRE